nr:hypothetical protein Iba_chr09fCG3600 [Ipomoea batatas]
MSEYVEQMNVLCDELSERLDLEIPRRQRDDEGTVERERALLPELCPAPLRYADDYVHVPRPLASIPNRRRL